MNKEEIDNKIKATVDARKKEGREKVLEELKKMPIVSVACDRASISRATYYNWRSEDQNFAKAADAAIGDGELFINDLGEAQIVNLIKDRNLPAILAWLKSHHPKYANKLELEARVKTDEPLTPEQTELIKRAIGSVATPKLTEDGDAGKQKADEIIDKENHV